MTPTELRELIKGQPTISAAELRRCAAFLIDAPEGECVLPLAKLALAADRIEELEKKWNAKMNEANDLAHVLLEHAVFPGMDNSCRCEQCRRVACAMDEAGYMELTDRWWENKS